MMANFMQKAGLVKKDIYHKVKQSQMRNALIAVIIMVAIGVIFTSVSRRGGEDFSFDESEYQQIDISDPASTLKAEDRWLEMAEKKLQKLQDQQEQQQEGRQQLDDKISALEEKIVAMHNNNSDNRLEDTDRLIRELELLRNRVDNIATGRTAKSSNAGKYTNHPSKSNNKLTDPFARNDVSNNKTPARTIANEHFSAEEIVIELDQIEEDDRNIYDTSSYLPAGSYAPAIVTSGVDASVGISSQSDPRPMLFRITAPAKSAMLQDQQQEVNITGCTVTGAASGDLSSEKTFIRLLKMVCAKEQDKIMETDVKGYVASRSKAGIRGRVISREGNLVTKSFLAGLTSGFGSAVSDRLASPSTVVGNALVDVPSNREIIGRGVGQGVSSSADRLSEYLIKRAEQYQPVIEVNAGQRVELVFHEGVFLDGR